MENFIKYDFEILPTDEIIKNSEDFFEKLSKRRSVRTFAKTPIPDEVIVNLIKTGATAPSGANKQPWFFYVIKDNMLKRRIREQSEKIERENYETRFSDEMKQDLKQLKTNADKPFLEDAPFLIIVCREKYKISGGKKEKNYYVNESVGIALGFMIAAIHLSGLVTVPYTPNPMHFLRELLEIPENLAPVVILPIGFPAAGTEVPDIVKKSVNEIMKVF